MRYRIYEELRIATRASCIAVGHHQDDQVETILLNLSRGLGGKDCGVELLSEQHMPSLLHTSKIAILDYLRERPELLYR